MKVDRKTIHRSVLGIAWQLLWSDGGADCWVEEACRLAGKDEWDDPEVVKVSARMQDELDCLVAELRRRAERP